MPLGSTRYDASRAFIWQTTSVGSYLIVRVVVFCLGRDLKQPSRAEAVLPRRKHGKQQMPNLLAPHDISF